MFTPTATCGKGAGTIFRFRSLPLLATTSYAIGSRHKGHRTRMYSSPSTTEAWAAPPVAFSPSRYHVEVSATGAIQVHDTLRDQARAQPEQSSSRAAAPGEREHLVVAPPTRLDHGGMTSCTGSSPRLTSSLNSSVEDAEDGVDDTSPSDAEPVGPQPSLQVQPFVRHSAPTKQLLNRRKPHKKFKLPNYYGWSFDSPENKRIFDACWNRFYNKPAETCLQSQWNLPKPSHVTYIHHTELKKMKKAGSRTGTGTDSLVVALEEHCDAVWESGHRTRDEFAVAACAQCCFQKEQDQGELFVLLAEAASGSSAPSSSSLREERPWHITLGWRGKFKARDASELCVLAREMLLEKAEKKDGGKDAESSVGSCVEKLRNASPHTKFGQIFVTRFKQPLLLSGWFQRFEN